MQSSLLRLTMYVCMYVCMYACIYAVTLQECNHVYYTCAYRCHGHALAGHVAPRWDKVRVKLEVQRLTRMREDARYKGGQKMIEREQRLTRMRNYARS